jgi:predicted Zn finger-like uncharacterized protein
MYTRCPECDTHFHITAENLRVANGEVCCGACETEFNALAYLVDEVPGRLIDDDGRDVIPDELIDDDDRGEIPEQESPENNDRLEHETWNQDEWRALLDNAQFSPDDSGAISDDTEDNNDRYGVPDELEDDNDRYDPASEGESEIYGEIIVLESGPDDAEPGSSDDDFDDSDTDYDDDSEDPEKPEPVVAEQLQDIEREFRKIDDDDYGESSEDFHRWLAGDLETGGTVETEPRPQGRGWLIAATILALTLLSQLLHYNRDSLAADSKYGGVVRGLYGRLGVTLYPEWELKSFEVRGTEAVAGDTASSALNILANVLVVSDQPVGMPMIRVVLHDRWSDPVASGVFQPEEYLGVQSSGPAVLEPGTTLPIKISVADPGSEARGYVVDICLPRRSTGLQCQLARDPFR